MQAIDLIREKVPHSELLAQLAEEASELAQAALKYRRACDGTNPTPVSMGQAFSDLQEEVADVLLLLQVLRLDGAVYIRDYHKIMGAKTTRWVTRLRESKEG